MTRVREATEDDITAVNELFAAAYGDHYAHSDFCIPDNLKKHIFDDDTLILVAEDTDNGRILGSASVILDLGAFGDLIGEFGRLVVHPGCRKRGIGKQLMKARLEAIEDRLHIAIVDNRTVHPYSQKISHAFDFVCTGFLPSKTLFKNRENIIHYVHYFGNALRLRRNHPHVIPETYELADQVLQSCQLTGDIIVDAESPAYQDPGGYDLKETLSKGYTSLLHFERGRVANREIFGPVKLHAGIFQLRVNNYRYILAYRNGHLVGGLGFHVDKAENSARLLELVSADDGPIRALLTEVTRICEQDEGVCYIEADISAYSPRMQRTLLELGYLPAAYIPAMAFHRVERLDAVRMVRLLAPLETDDIQLYDSSLGAANIVIRQFRQHVASPHLLELAPGMDIFHGLNASQTKQLAAICTLKSYSAGDILIEQGTPAGHAHLVLAGAATITINGRQIGSVGPGEALGEISLLRGTPHATTATATDDTETATIDQEPLQDLIRRRPDIGLVLYRNLATQLGRKLLRADEQLMQ